jgi:predicted amidophosphoribosyltransferase
MSKICSNCGKEIVTGWKYCPYCGFPLTEDKAVFFIRKWRDLKKTG